MIEQWRLGRVDARDRLIARLYPELCQIAAVQLRGERNSSLSTGDVINNVVVKLMRVELIDLADRAHLLALAARMMRNILIDDARLRSTGKRAHQKIELQTNIDGEQRFELISLDSALIRLGAIDAKLAELVEMRYFGGMTIADVAVVTGAAEATVKRRWAVARAWLVDALMNPIGRD